MSLRSNTYRHIVLFKFYDKVTPEVIKTIEDAFRAFCKELPFVKDFEFGRNSSPEKKSEGYTHCFIITFENEASRDQYLPHPAHQAFCKDYLDGTMEKVLVIDYVPVD